MPAIAREVQQASGFSRHSLSLPAMLVLLVEVHWVAT